MNTSNEAIRLLTEALNQTHAATAVINDLVVEHDYQDVAALVSQAGAALLEAAISLMNSQDVVAFEGLETADDLLDAVYDIIDSETDEDED